MSRSPGKTTVEAWPADRDRLNELAAQLTADGHGGRFGQAEALRWVLNAREDLAGQIALYQSRIDEMAGLEAL
jgi:hypothetical protein